MIEKDHEYGERLPKKSKGEARISLMEGFREDAKATFAQILKEQKESGLDKVRLERTKRMAILSFLILAELIPGVEATNETVKGMSKFEKIFKKIKEKSPDAIKVAQSKGLIGDLYPNVPDWFVSSLAVIDAFGAPGIGILPDVFQLQYDKFMQIKDDIKVYGGAVSTFKEIRKQRKSQISQAVLAFA